MHDGREILYFTVGLKKLHSHALLGTGITERELIVLTTIDEQNKRGAYKIGIQASKLCDILRISRPNMTKIINGLEDAKCIERIFNKTDRRNVYLIILQKGDGLLDKVAMEIKSKILGLLGEEKAQEYYSVVNRLANLVEEIQKEDK